MVRTLFVAIAALVMVSGAASAQAPSETNLNLAREIVTLSGAGDNARAGYASMAPMMLDQMRRSGMGGEDAERLVELMAEEFEATIPEILELVAIAYAGAFTEQQLTELRDFYRSETGQALRRQTPEITMALARAGEIFGREAAERAVERWRREREQGRRPGQRS